MFILLSRRLETALIRLHRRPNSITLQDYEPKPLPFPLDAASGRDETRCCVKRRRHWRQMGAPPPPPADEAPPAGPGPSCGPCAVPLTQCGDEGGVRIAEQLNAARSGCSRWGWSPRRRGLVNCCCFQSRWSQRDGGGQISSAAPRGQMRWNRPPPHHSPQIGHMIHAADFGDGWSASPPPDDGSMFQTASLREQWATLVVFLLFL